MKCSSHLPLIPSLFYVMVEPSADIRGGCSTSGRTIDGLDSVVQHLRAVGVSVELHFFSFLLPPSVLYAAKLSLGSDLTVSVSVAP